MTNDSSGKELKKISVVMCTYNGEKYIEEQINSIIGQTYPIYELIIQDDHSTDNTFNILKDYAARYPFISLYTNDDKRGINGNFFSAMRKAKGDYIAISDQDDVWETDKLELQINSIGNNLLCSGLSKPFSTDGTAVKFDARTPNATLIRTMYVGTLPGHTFLMPKRILELLPADEKIMDFRCYDAIFTMIAAAFNSIVYVNKLLVNQRRHCAASTYTAPTDSKASIKNYMSYLFSSFKLYNMKKNIIRERFIKTSAFLETINSDSKELKDARKMAKLHSSSAFFNLIPLSYLSLKNKDKIFFSPQIKGLITSIRAIFFPITCSIYFRGSDS